MMVREVEEVLKDSGVEYNNLSIDILSGRNRAKKTYLLKGQFKVKGREYNDLVLKSVDNYSKDEIMFYNEDDEFLKGIRPDVIVADESKNIIILEKVNSTFYWNNEMFKVALSTIADIHAHFWNKSNIYWIKDIKNSRLAIKKDDLRNAYSRLLSEDKLLIFRNHYDFLVSCLEKVESMESLLMHNSSLLHGDLHTINSGVKGDRVLFFDWNTVRYGNVAYDISYLLESVYEYNKKKYEDLMPKFDLIDLYIYKMAYRGIRIDRRDFLRSYFYTYIYKVITSILPIYFGRYLDGESPIKTHVENQISKIKEMYRYI